MLPSVHAAGVSAQAVLPPPTLVTATTTDSTKVLVKWARVMKATGYLIERKTPAGVAVNFDVVGGATTQFDDDSAVPTIKYSCRIASVHEGKIGVFSTGSAIGIRLKTQPVSKSPPRTAPQDPSNPSTPSTSPEPPAPSTPTTTPDPAEPSPPVAAPTPAPTEDGTPPSKPVRELPWAETLTAQPDPSAVTSPALRDAIIATGLPWRVKENASGIELLLIPPGKFNMGKSPGDKEAEENELPTHEVTLTRAYYIGRFEVTQGQWEALMKDNPSSNRDPTGREAKVRELQDDGFTLQEAEKQVGPREQNEKLRLMLPVDSVTASQCKEFCKKASLRLPTEAEWEYACRAGTTGPRYGELEEIAWCIARHDMSGLRAKHRFSHGARTQQIGTKSANPLGLYDLLGNVSEPTQDWMGDSNFYRQCESGVVDPCNPWTDTKEDASGIDNHDPIYRGGSASTAATSMIRCSHRTDEEEPHTKGLRVARDP